jgi:hypothetical protein
VTDQLEDLFADLRADTMTRVRPPGAVAARHTLRRRRTRRTVGAAAFLVVAGAGGLSATIPLRTDGSNDPNDLAERAAAVAGLDTGAPHTGTGVARSGDVATALMAAGTYTLTLACVGRGWLNVTLRSPKGQVGAVGAECRTNGDMVHSMTFRLAENESVTTQLNATGGAEGNAGYLYQAALLPAERAVIQDIARKRLDGKITYSEFLTGNAAHDTVVESGTYQAVFTCAGAGIVGVTVQFRPSTDQVIRTVVPVDCATGATHESTMELPSGGLVETMIQPDDDARGQAAVAVQLERV